MTEHEVYEFYNTHVKIIYTEIEARNNTLPVELLFEIHAAFDHLKRMHIDGESEKSACDKAYSHLKRGLLDAFKLKLKYHNEESAVLIRNKKDLKLIDNGSFLPNLLHDRKELISVAKQARLLEGLRKGDEAFESWYSVSLKIDEIENQYFATDKLEWANQQSLRKTAADWRLSLLGGFISGVLATLFCGVIFSAISKVVKLLFGQ